MRSANTSIYRRARLSRDPRFDGLFFIGVTTTGIYCRPICPARLPREENVRYFASAAEAAQAGFRPCLRCRPESAPASPAWVGTDTTVNRAVALIQSGFLNDAKLAALADRLGVGERYLRKLFDAKLGVSPQALAHTQRLHLAQKLLKETALPVTQVAFAAGFRSLRRFNSATQDAFGCAPSALRRTQSVSARAGIELSLSLRQPYDWQGVIALFRRHAVAGLDEVNEDQWTRSLATPHGAAKVTVAQRMPGALQASIRLSDNRDLMAVVAQLRRIFDLDAQPADIADALGEDALLLPLLKQRPGIRSPCFATPFEACVRAVLGQQVSTAAARTHCERIVDACNQKAEIAGETVPLFPTPRAMLEIPDSVLRMPAGRRATLRRLCELFAAGHVEREQLLSVKGVGPWTADLVDMRGHGRPDQFPLSDLGLVRAVEAEGFSQDALKLRQQQWTPWRSYAANLLWRSLDHG
ncbi:MAG: Ada metal-binding domain-containing protein [Pseudomonadota bacterium]